MSSLGDDFEVASASGSDMTAECVDEYSVDSDGNIKPDQDAPKIKGAKVDDLMGDPDKPKLTPEERRK